MRLPTTKELFDLLSDGAEIKFIAELYGYPRDEIFDLITWKELHVPTRTERIQLRTEMASEGRRFPTQEEIMRKLETENPPEKLERGVRKKREAVPRETKEPVKLTKERLENYIRRNFTLERVMKESRHGQKFVREAFRAHGLSIKQLQRQQKRAPLTTKELKQMLDEGRSMKEAAILLQCNPDSLRAAYRRKGIDCTPMIGPRKPKQKKRRERALHIAKKDVQAAYGDRTLSVREAADKLGVDTDTLYWLVDLHKVPRRAVKRPSDIVLKVKYIDRNMTILELAGFYKVSESTMRSWLRDAKLFKRSFNIPSKEELERYYIKRKMTAAQIGKLYGKSDTVIRRWLRKRGIKRPEEKLFIPPFQELHELYILKRWSRTKVAAHYNVSNKRVDYWLKERHLSRRNFDVVPPPKKDLVKAYVIENKTMLQLRRMYRVSHDVLSGWMEMYEIPKRVN